MKGEFLYRVRPDLFPVAMLTPLETELWGLFFEEQKARQEQSS
ncbi:hypothetical protein [Modicisalibacter luteus]